jgi:uncharacterized membrane protein
MSNWPHYLIWGLAAILLLPVLLNPGAWVVALLLVLVVVGLGYGTWFMAKIKLNREQGANADGPDIRAVIQGDGGSRDDRGRDR